MMQWFKGLIPFETLIINYDFIHKGSESLLQKECLEVV